MYQYPSSFMTDNISFNGYVTIWICFSLSVDICAAPKKVSMDIYEQEWYAYIFTFLFLISIYGITRSYGGHIFKFLRISSFFPKWFYHFTLLPTIYKVLVLPHILHNIWCSQVLWFIFSFYQGYGNISLWFQFLFL